MALDIQSQYFTLPMKFEKLHFFRDDVSNESMSSISSEASSPADSPPVEAYEIQVMKPSDSEAVLNHLRKFFFKDEPLNINVKLLEGENAKCTELEEYSLKSINDYPGISLMAVSTTNKIVGVVINGTKGRGDVSADDEKCANPKFEKILNLLGMIDEKLDIFGRYPDVQTIMNCNILSVDSNWRGRGIAKQLMDKTREIASKKGYGLLRVDCTSAFSAKVVARLGFEQIYALKYTDYKEDGRVVFDPEPPHTEVAVYVQKIPKHE